ncbi:HAD-IA family hydrolase [Streptomyces sp. NPDC091682]|uniref:HAD family hydrolase n=1 Tax=Streptomyces sp. NPDC091682 TaxID=3366005 RepID=UPI00381424F1
MHVLHVRHAAILRTEGVRTFDDVRPALRALREKAIRCAAVPASRNARSLLEAAGLIGYFDALVDGQDAAALALPGKPDPAPFLEAAGRLDVNPARTVVVEDALAGVDAGRRGRFRLVVGLDREGDPRMRDALHRFGAQLVLPDLGGLPAPPRRGPPPANTPWRWGYHRYDPKTGRLVDSLCTLGNGRFATRGSAPESVADGIHYPGTYLAGCRTALPALVASKRSFCRSGAGRAAVGRLTQTVNGERLEMGSSRTGVRRGPPRQARPRCG